MPARLMIPQLTINASVEHVGLAANGEMGVPIDPYNVAWYKSGPSPGKIGSSVIGGHFGMANGKPAVFDDLHKLRRGDRLYVQDEKGTTTTFTVRKLQTFSHDDNAEAVFVSNDGKAHLNLITCAGTWNKATLNYSNRTVVFTDLN